MYRLISKVLLVSAVLVITSGCDLLRDIPVGLGHSAKSICSAVFNSGFDEERVVEEFVAPQVQPLPLFWKIEVDYQTKQVEVWDTVYGRNSAATAIFTQGKGCTLLTDKSREEVESIAFEPAQAVVLDPAIPWPYGDGGMPQQTLAGVDYERVNRAVASAFEDVHTSPINTTSVLVAHQGRLIAERYQDGVDEDTLLIGWSMTKSLVGMLAGILIDQGRLQLDEPVPIEAWQGTEKGDITTRNLLNMASGIENDEDYSAFSGVTQMLYLEADQFAHALDQDLAFQPGEQFQYSTAEANRLSAVVQQAAGGSQQAMYDFYQNQLFEPLGINGGFVEFDASGNMVGGAYGHLTARDWARLGQLYLQRGNWNGAQIISAEYVDFATTPAPLEGFSYGAQLWLNVDGLSWQQMPHDTFYLSGHQGQLVVVIPSHELVVVRTGITQDDDALIDEVMTPMITEIMASLPTTSP